MANLAGLPRSWWSTPSTGAATMTRPTATTPCSPWHAHRAALRCRALRQAASNDPEVRVRRDRAAAASTQDAVRLGGTCGTGGGRSFWAEVFGRRVRGSIQLVQ